MSNPYAARLFLEEKHAVDQMYRCVLTSIMQSRYKTETDMFVGVP